MSAASSNAIALVAEREVRERFRSGGFWMATWFAVVAVVVAVALPAWRGNEKRSFTIGVVGPISAGLRAELGAIGPAVTGGTSTVQDLQTEAGAKSALSAKTIDVAVINNNSVLVKQPVDRSAHDARTRFVAAVATVVGLRGALDASGLTSGQIESVIASENAVPVETLSSGGQPVDLGNRRAATAVGISLIVLFLLVYGSWVLNGVVEEKSSRVVEVLLSAVTAKQLLRGKLIGIGAVALAQGVLVAAAALTASAIVGSSSPLRGQPSLLAGLLGWFLLAYALYAAAFATVGSLATRYEEAQNASFLILTPLLAAVAACVPTLNGSAAGPLVTVLSFVPLTAPVAMPVRAASGSVPGYQIALSIISVLAAAILVSSALGRRYSQAVLQTTRRSRRAHAAPAAAKPAA